MIFWAANLTDCDSWVRGRFGLFLLRLSVLRRQYVGQCGIGSVRQIPKFGFNATAIISWVHFLMSEDSLISLVLLLAPQLEESQEAEDERKEGEQ